MICVTVSLRDPHRELGRSVGSHRHAVGRGFYPDSAEGDALLLPIVKADPAPTRANEMFEAMEEVAGRANAAAAR